MDPVVDRGANRRDQSPDAAKERLRNLTFVFALACALWGLHAFWLSRDTRPPLWDMAAHQTYALNYLPGADLPPDLSFWRRSWNYPPFVHVAIAFAFWLFHPGPHVAILANVPATFLLFWGIFDIARMLAGPGAARWAALLTALTPFLIWISRETILDYWLGAWVVVSLALLLKSEGFRSRKFSILFGLACACGLLTKWLFFAFLTVPTVYIAVRDQIWRSKRKVIHFTSACFIAVLVAGIWYFPNLPSLIQFFRYNAQIGAREGEPPVLSFQSLIYYLRLLEGYQLFGLIFSLLVLSVFFVCRRRGINEGGLLALTISGGWFAMTALRTKDPRFTLPLLGLMMVFPGAWIQSWGKGWKPRLAQSVLVALLCIQAYAINFGISWLPQEVVLARGYQGSLRWDWNLYLQNYFHVLGAPKREDWKLDAILNRLADDAHKRKIRPDLALIPDLPRFNSVTFQLYARLHGLSSQVGHPQSAQDGMKSLNGYNYVIVTSEDQGMSWTTRESRALNDMIVNESAKFHPLDEYPLPNGDKAHLYVILRGAE